MLQIRDLHGVLPALASPLTSTGEVDEPGVHRLVEHTLAGGVHGLLALGSTGETASLDEPARRRLLSAVVEAAGGRSPVICGIAQPHLKSAIAEAEAAARLGAGAVLAAPPFYYPTDQATVIAFYRELALASPLPVLVYNIPQFTKVVVEPASLAVLAGEGAIVGIKDSSRDFEYFERVLAATAAVDGFRVFTGSDGMLVASLAMGAAGTICGSANVAPSLVVEVYELWTRGDLEAARAAQNRLLELVLATRVGVFPAAIKSALALLGVCERWPAPPLAPLAESAEARLRDQLAGWGLLAPARAESPA